MRERIERLLKDLDEIVESKTVEAVETLHQRTDKAIREVLVELKTNLREQIARDHDDHEEHSQC